jgi:propanol-preferring alcohol dehydrogenase
MRAMVLRELARVKEGAPVLELADLPNPEAGPDCLLRIDYPTYLGLQKKIRSVANVTRAGVIKFLDLATGIPVQPTVEEYRLEDAIKHCLSSSGARFGAPRYCGFVRLPFGRLSV